MDQIAPKIQLLRNKDNNIITPFYIPDFQEIKSGRSNNSGYLFFEISAPQNRRNGLSVSIYSGNRLIHSENLQSNAASESTIPWKWDGFSSQGIFDSKQLKNKSLTVQLEINNSSAPVHKIELHAKSAEKDWLDIKIDRTQLTIDVELRVNIKDGGSNGVGEFPPSEVQNTSAYRNFPASSPLRQRHHRLKGFVALKQLAFAGIQKYWGRKIKLSDNKVYALKVTPVDATTHAMDDIKVVYNTNGEWMRSSNPGPVTGVYSLFGNILPEQIVYNVGWLEFSNGWGYQNQMAADRQFMETAAHELGHEILSSYGGDEYSYGHRGSSTVITQETKSVSGGGSRYPATGEIDLMKYYNGARPRNFYNRVLASEMDVKSLIWLSRVKFDD
jgi:hypothetical protein